MEDDLFTAETRRIPADVVRAVIEASEKRAKTPAPVPSLPSGTRRRVSAHDIAQYLAARGAPIVDSYAPERVEDIVVVDDADLVPEPEPERATVPDEPPAARRRVPLEPIPLAVFPRGVYPSPRIARLATPTVPVLERPLAVFFLSMGAVILLLLPLVYLLVRR